MAFARWCAADAPLLPCRNRIRFPTTAEKTSSRRLYRFSQALPHFFVYGTSIAFQIQKVNISKKLHSFVWTNLFLICVENKLAPLYLQKVLKIILTARQNMKNICNYRRYGNFWQLKRRFDRHKTGNYAEHC